MAEFVHLHNHTHYSILDATITVAELVKAAVEDNQNAVALTEHGVMFGSIEFYETCKKYNIKPIIGCEVYIASGSRFDKNSGNSGKDKIKKKNYYHLILLAKDETGYKNLMKLSSIGHNEGFYYRPRIDKEVLERYYNGLICTSACLGGVVSAHLRNNDYAEAKREAEYYKALFGNDFYIELQNHGIRGDKEVLQLAPKLAKELNIKLVATNDIHYLKKEDAIAHNVLLNIKDAKGKVDININDLRYGTSEYYFKTQAEMKQLFADFPEAIANTCEIAEKCNLEIQLNKLYMPVFPIPDNAKEQTLSEYLANLVNVGLEKKYENVTPEIKQRAEYELDIINKMDFSGYFLIVWDFIRAARELGVRVGPGRGSAAGSIVAYALDITNVDPLKYDLLFERFLNPERVSMPDIDIDFNDETRDKVIDYVKNKYGESSVAQIITFGTLTSRAVIKDVGRVLGVDLDTVAKITKQFEINFGKVESIDEAMKKASLKWLKDDTNPKLHQLIEYARILENKNRNTGTHAAGVVIAPGDISDYVPLYRPEKSTKVQSLEIVTQYEMGHLEKIGLLKMDFLGLTTLSIIERALEMIKVNTGEQLDLEKIDFDDVETYKLLGNGQTQSIFQFEGNGMQEYLRQLKPQNLEELTAMNALYRPGPIGNIPTFIKRKHGKEGIKYLHPIMEKSLKKTYGIIVYQEQVMQLARDLAGFSLGEADVMRRAMGKKKPEEMAKLKPKFSEGCAKNNISKSLADEIFDLIAEFANYGFNKSHSLAYSYLAFQTAWLKTHYPAEFFASCMTASMNELDRLVNLITDTRKQNIEVFPPDINISDTNFIAREGKIFFGLAGIKNVGVSAVENIVATRAGGKFTSIFDFTSRVDTRIVNKRALEALVSTGAFDSIYGVENRASLFNSVDLALEFAKTINSRSENLMDDIFGGADETLAEQKEPELIFSAEWSNLERINKEKEYVNFYISGHPLDEYYTEITSLNTINLSESDEDKVQSLAEEKSSDNYGTSYGLISGLITEIRTREDRSKNKIAFATIENYTGTAELAFWSETYANFNNFLAVGNIICCQGKIVKERGDLAKVTVDEVYPIEKTAAKYFSGYVIYLDAANENSDIATSNKLKELHKLQNISTQPARLRFKVATAAGVANYAAKDINLPLDSAAIKSVAGVFGRNNVSMLVMLPSAPAENNRRKGKRNF